MERLYILDGPEQGKAFDIKSDTVYYVGRSPANHIQLTDIYVSRRHLKIFRRGDQYLIEDLHSKNGTCVNGELIDQGVEVEVQEGVPIIIGISVICLGKKCLEEVKALIDSITYAGTPKKIEEKDTVMLKQATECND